MALKSALAWGAAQSALRLVVGFISIKVTAVYLGAPGLALVGQINNFMALVVGGVANAVQTGVVRMTAESGADRQRHVAIWRTGILLGLLLSLPLGILSAILSKPVSGWLFDDDGYWPVVALAGVAVVFTALSYVLIGMLNGLKRMRDVALAQILTMLASAAVFIPSAYVWGLWGGLVGSVVAAATAFFMVLPFARKATGLGIRDLHAGMDGKIARDILGYLPMLLANASMGPLGLILVRTALSDGLGMDVAGYWQAMWRISEMYTMVLTTALSLFLMPHLSSCKDERQFASELFKITLQVAGITLLAIATIYVLRDLVVRILFTPDFFAVTDLFAWQLLGDLLRMIRLPLGTVLVIKKRAAWYIALEVGTPSLHAGMTWLLLDSLGANAATLGYAVAYLVVDLLLLVALRDYLGLWLTSRKGEKA
jgi:PST family polysaccharide transporter